jgi:AAA+ ATPase superfamily predicted ATPase
MAQVRRISLARREATNPFRYGGVVQENAFCNRKQELSDLLRAAVNSEKLFLYSERRLGKTSLVRLMMKRLPAQTIGIYVDLLPTDNEAAFAAVTAKALSEALSTTADKLLKTAKRLFTRLVPAITTDEFGRPKVTFDVSSFAEPSRDLEEVLEAPARLAEEGHRKVVVAFDECQQILEYGSDRLERRLRTIIQNHQQVAYIFLGSRKHLIHKMFLDETRPLYRAGGHYPLGPIAPKHWLPFIRERFLAADKKISDGQVLTICGLTDGHPFYTQHLSHALWEICAEHETVTDEMIRTALHILLDRESYAYTTLWESLAINQRRFLTGLAHEPRGVKPFASGFTRRYGLRSASNAQRAVEALLERDIVDRDNGSFLVIDRFFRLWVRQMTADSFRAAR